MKLTEIVEKKSESKKVCKGLFFRANCNTYFQYNKGTITRKVTLKLLKRLSCKGCEKCGWMLAGDFSEISEDYSNVIFDHVKNGKIYTPVVVNISKDWETGYCDDYDIEMQEVKNKE